jgi:ligand-binding sensor domain-containing protein
MKIDFVRMPFFTFLAIVFLGTACNAPVKNDLPIEQKRPTVLINFGNGNVECSLEDKRGNLWFGTSEGLYQYDGKSFVQYTVANGLAGNYVSSIIEDKDGKIWIGTKEGLCFYDGKTFTKVEIPLPKNLPPNKNTYFQNHWVYSMVQAKSGKFWFVTIDGVYVYDGKTFTHFPMMEAPNGFLTENDKVERILEDKAGNIWLGGRTNEGVFLYDGTSLTNLKPQELIQGQNGPRPRPLRWGWPQWQDKNGNIWFSSWGGAYKYDGKRFTGFSTKDGLPTEVTKIIEDKNGNLWFGASDGLRRYDGENFTHFKEGLINPWIWTILEDKNKNIWVGTREGGLFLFDGKTFINYSAKE